MAETDQTIEGLQEQLESLSQTTDPATSLAYASKAMELAGRLLDLDQKDESRIYSRPAVDVLMACEEYEEAARACQYVYLAEGEDALPAIGQAAWLSVTYPIDPALTAVILEHIVDETPDDSDGAAVAAATAHYVADLRAEDRKREELVLFTGGLLARVARRHSNVLSQEDFATWVSKLELDNPEKFLTRLRNVIDVLVQTEWWFDRDALTARLP